MFGIGEGLVETFAESVRYKLAKHMKQFPFGTFALAISILLFVSAAMVFLGEYFQIGESNPIYAVFFYVILILFLLELPLHSVSQALGFPIIVPSITFVLAVLGLIKDTSRKSYSIVAIILTIVSILLYLGVRFLF